MKILDMTPTYYDVSACVMEIVLGDRVLEKQ